MDEVSTRMRTYESMPTEALHSSAGRRATALATRQVSEAIPANSRAGIDVSPQEPPNPAELNSCQRVVRTVVPSEAVTSLLKVIDMLPLTLLASTGVPAV